MPAIRSHLLSVEEVGVRSLTHCFCFQLSNISSVDLFLCFWPPAPVKIGSNASGAGSRYQSLRYQEKSSLVDELVEISGYHRKTAVRLSRQRWNAMGTWRLNQFSGRSCCKSAQPGPIDWWIWHEKQVVSSVDAAARALSRAVVDAQQCARSMAGRVLSGAGLKWRGGQLRPPNGGPFLMVLGAYRYDQWLEQIHTAASY